MPVDSGSRLVVIREIPQPRTNTSDGRFVRFSAEGVAGEGHRRLPQLQRPLSKVDDGKQLSTLQPP